MDQTEDDEEEDKGHWTGGEWKNILEVATAQTGLWSH
jgi:hypothetical protein